MPLRPDNFRPDVLAVLTEDTTVSVDGIDYASIATKAKTLIDANGREVAFLRYDQSPGDADKPWEGPIDPTASPDATTTVRAVFVQPASLKSLGLGMIDDDLLKRASRIAIVPGSGATFDLATANEVSDGGERRRVAFVETLKPGSVTLLYFVGITR